MVAKIKERTAAIMITVMTRFIIFPWGLTKTG